MKKLVIAEKPSVGKEIARVLGCKNVKNGLVEGDEYIVTWAMGHLVTLADPDMYNKKYQNWKIEDLPIIPETMKLVVIKQTGKQYHLIKELLHRSDVGEIIIATDAGREGELVARWILEKSANKKPIKRLWTSSITDKALKEGFKKLESGKKYENLYQSAEARAVADWIVGINATRALTTKYNAQLSCGRVQTPTLAIIFEREEEIKNFLPKTFYGLQAMVNGQKCIWKDKETNSGQTFNKEKIEAICDKIKGSTAEVTSVSKKQKAISAPLLYDLTELQRDAYTYFGYSPKKTLNLMQKLYETHKVLSYPRTDSRYITDDMVETINDRLKTIQGDPYKKTAMDILKRGFKANKNFVNNGKVSDHHAIIPTEQTVLLHTLSYDERNIYELVIKRFLEVLLPAFEYEETSVELITQNEKLELSGKKIIQQGWKILAKQNEETSQLNFEKGQKIAIQSVKVTQGETNPPPRFNEGSLLTAMEHPEKFLAKEDAKLKEVLNASGGLGTVATRADIIEKLFNTQLIELTNKQIYITSKGKQLLDLAPEALKSPKLTGAWELKLKDIEQGKLNKKSFIQEMKNYTEEIVAGIKSSEAKYRHDNLTTAKCPECGKNLLEIKNKRGNYLVCADRQCGYKKTMSMVTNARCPECHKKLDLVGTGDKQSFVCQCGYKEKMDSFKKRKAEQSKNGSKKDYINYKKQQTKEAEPIENDAFAALKNLKF